MSFLHSLIAIPVLTLAACSDQNSAESREQIPKEHFLQDQVRALEKAKGVEQTLQDASVQQRRILDSEDK